MAGNAGKEDREGRGCSNPFDSFTSEKESKDFGHPFYAVLSALDRLCDSCLFLDLSIQYQGCLYVNRYKYLSVTWVYGVWIWGDNPQCHLSQKSFMGSPNLVERFAG